VEKKKNHQQTRGNEEPTRDASSRPRRGRRRRRRNHHRVSFSLLSLFVLLTQPQTRREKTNRKEETALSGKFPLTSLSETARANKYTRCLRALLLSLYLNLFLISLLFSSNLSLHFLARCLRPARALFGLEVSLSFSLNFMKKKLLVPAARFFFVRKTLTP
jgi:hypothetical protein